VRGGVKFYSGSARAARAYLEADRSRADDYYLAEGSGLAERLVATPEAVEQAGSLTGEGYERWVAGYQVDTGRPKGRLRNDADALRFVEVVVNGPKTWSLAAALDSTVSAALDVAQEQAARQIIGYLAEHATTRVGPRGRQVQVPVEQVEAAVIRHYTSRAGDPHRHLHLQVNARVWAEGKWRGLHSVGFRDMIEAVNGIGHAAVATNPQFRQTLATRGLTLDPESGEIEQLAPFVGVFSARAGQIRRNIDRYEAAWRREHPGEEPGPRLREVWDRRAWAQARPDKLVPTDGRELVARWKDELRDLGYHDPGAPVRLEGTRPGWINRDATAELVVSRLGAKRSAWNTADIRGTTEVLLAQTCLVADPAVRVEVAEDITARATARCTPLLRRGDVPEHLRSLSSPRVLEVEADLVGRLARRGGEPARRVRVGGRGLGWIDPTQAAVVSVLAGSGRLVVVEGAAGSGKTTTLRATQRLLAGRGHRLLVVTPTLKAAEVAAAETGADGHSAAWLIHQHGWRCDTDGHWTRQLDPTPEDGAQLRPGDLLLVDEAGMLDQDTAHALATISDETGARLALVGDRHQLPAVGRGGVLDYAIAWAHPTAVVRLEKVHRFTDPEYADLSLKMRTGADPAAVFDTLCRRGQIVIHPSEVERIAALAEAGAAGDLVIADRRDQVADLNAAIRDRRAADRAQDEPEQWVVTTASGERIGLGDRVATRRNVPVLGIANRQTWTIAGIGEDGSILLHGPQRPGPGRYARDREVPGAYARRYVELAYATTVHGAQGETVDRAHFALGETTGAAAAYVAMTRGRDTNTAHLVADDVVDARRQWSETFARDRADLGPTHARGRAIDDIERYGPQAPRQPRRQVPPSLSPASMRPPERREPSRIGL
jgi:exodeoxyribonuclease V alpha subunit